MSGGKTAQGAVRAAVAEMTVAAMDFVAGSKVEEIARGLLPRGAGGAAVAMARRMAVELALFTPSASGQTAFDRLERQRRGLRADAVLALAVLCGSAARLLRVERVDGIVVTLHDLANGQTLTAIDEAIGPDLVGLRLVGRLGALGDGRYCFVSAITPLDEAGYAVAAGLVRAGGLPARSVEAVYRHVVRHGTVEISGLNRPGDDEADTRAPESDLDRIASRWAAERARHPSEIQRVRNTSDLRSILRMLVAAALRRMHGLAALSAAYVEVVSVQLDAVRRRSAAGSGELSLDAVMSGVEAAIAQGVLPPHARDVLREARERLGMGAGGGGGRDAEIDRLIGKIQALRAKTVERGCTEAEALAAAEKVAELLDRYGLSLSTLDLQRQTCEGSAIETTRKRAGPVDECVPAIAAFFDCRVWGEKGADGTLRYVFFGMPADVAAAQYLYDLVELAFVTEAASFKAGTTYGGMPTGMRRTASNSFGLGFSRGLTAKLRGLREAREGALRGAAGRDLVVAKAKIVDEELERLGLRLRKQSGPRGTRVLEDAFQEGREAGLGFDYTPGLSG